MADEWSKPVMTGDEWESERLGSSYGYKRVGVADEDLRIDTDLSSSAAPRDVVLRLLAAEASDRLGWVWEVGVDKFTGRLAASRPQWPAQWEVFFDGTITSESEWGCPGTPDELLAAMHGRFLLEDALREAQ